MADQPFVPLIDRGALEESDTTCIENVVVPLMLVRHVVELPDPGAFADAVERLRADVTRHVQSGERQYAFAAGQTPGGDALGVILYPALEKAEIIGLGIDDGARTSRMTLSPNGLHLLHGFLTFVVHSLAALHPTSHPYGVERPLTQPENADVAAVQQALLAQVDPDNMNQALCLFQVRVVDSFGRPTFLDAKWYPNLGRASWEWRFVEETNGPITGGVAFDMEYATLLAGFFTVLRLAFTEEWSWQEK